VYNPFRKPPQQPALAVQTATAPAVEQRSDNDAWAWAEGWSGASSVAGAEVSPLNALSCPPVLAAVNLIAGIVGTLPVNVFQPAGGGGKQVATDNPAQDIVKTDANPWTGAGELRAQLTADALLWGQGVALVIRDVDGNPRELHRLLPTSVISSIDPATSEPTYQYGLGEANAPTVYSWRDLIVIRPTVQLSTIGAFGFQNGLAPIKAAKNAIGLAIALEAHASRLMANGGRPGGILSFPAKLGNEVAKRIKASWQAATSGRASGATAVLEEGGTFTPLAFTSVDAQFAEMRDFQTLEIARAFGVPPPFLADHGRATWSNFEQSARQLVTYGLAPWFKAWEAAYRRVLLTDAERASGLHFAFDLDGLLDGDLTARASAYASLISSRVLNPNEAREREHLPAYTGGEAFTNPNTTPAPPAGPPSQTENNV
jgi:HK97 family phage portal protein